jgi:hypothetical protein
VATFLEDAVTYWRIEQTLTPFYLCGSILERRSRIAHPISLNAVSGAKAAFPHHPILKNAT